MKKQLFSDEQKSKLAGLKVSYSSNRKLAKMTRLSSLQAAEALWDILDIFLKAVVQVETEREFTELVRRYNEVTANKQEFLGSSVDSQKAEFTLRLTAARAKARSEVRRLRKSL